MATKINYDPRFENADGDPIRLVGPKAALRDLKEGDPVPQYDAPLADVIVYFIDQMPYRIDERTAQEFKFEHQRHAFQIIKAFRGLAARKKLEVDTDAWEWLKTTVKEIGPHAFRGVVPFLLHERLVELEVKDTADES